MRDDKTKQPNHDDLSEVKSLIGDAAGDEFSLDEILAEFGSGKARPPGAIPISPADTDLPWPQPPRRGKQSGKVVAFPGAQPAPEEAGSPAEDEPANPEEAEDEDASAQGEDSSPEEESDDEPDEDDADEETDREDDEQEDDTQDRIVEFPKAESVLTSFLKNLRGRADRYADRMFEEDEQTDLNRVHRLERLIPGTDQEHRKPPRVPHRLDRPKPPPPPDTPPQELARTYGKGLTGLRVRVLLLSMVAILALVQLLIPALGFSWLAPLDDMSIQRWAAAGLMAAGVLLGIDQIARSLVGIFRMKIGMDTLTALACLFTLGDSLSLALQPDYPDRLPYTVVALTGLLLTLHGVYHKKCALRLSCKTAASSSTPYRVTLDEEKWDGRDTFAKGVGDSTGFGSQIQMDDGTQKMFYAFCPFLLVGDIALGFLASYGVGQPQQLLWTLSALFCATAAFGGAVAYNRPFHKVARRLSQSGAALAGWPGMAVSRRGDRVLVTDTDLFPPGYVELNGYKVMRDFSTERVLAYTATLIRDSGSGLAKIFHDQLRALGGLMRRSEGLCCYEGGGLSATIRNDQVLVGSAAFMNLMEVSLPQGMNVKSAVFCAINGELAGIFALNYSLPDTVFPSMEELIEAKIVPVLATRDFNLIPAMLHQRFKLAADKMDFPPVERRRELSDPNQTHGDTLVALLCREGLYPFAEAVTAAKRLRTAAKLGAVVCCAGSALGLVLCTYLTSVSAYHSLSPLSLLVYLLTWFAPVWFLSGWVHRF